MSTNTSDGPSPDDSDRFKDAAPDMATGRVRWYALVFLVIIAACLAEFLTGSTPVLVTFTHPLGFATLVGMYGGGALLIREVALRWRKRWGAVLLLGGAYAVGEEGFGAKTMVDPTGSNIGTQLYSHWMGVNWVPLSYLTVFHSAFSIGVPLVLVELIFPQTKGRRLLGNIGLGVTLVAYAVAIYLVSLGDPFVPPSPGDRLPRRVRVGIHRRRISRTQVVPAGKGGATRPSRAQFSPPGARFHGRVLPHLPLQSTNPPVAGYGRALYPAGGPHCVVPGEACGSIWERPRKDSIRAGDGLRLRPHRRQLGTRRRCGGLALHRPDHRHSGRAPPAKDAPN
jgi:hypothetical protein